MNFEEFIKTLFAREAAQQMVDLGLNNVLLHMASSPSVDQPPHAEVTSVLPEPALGAVDTFLTHLRETVQEQLDAENAERGEDEKPVQFILGMHIVLGGQTTFSLFQPGEPTLENIAIDTPAVTRSSPFAAG